ERIGKRLPDEAEYEFAATGGGKLKYPWGDEFRLAGEWTFGPVRQPDFDRTRTQPKVYGLYSNVAEWTTFWMYPYPSAHPLPLAANPSPDMHALVREARVVRGGAYSVVEGSPGGEELSWGPRFRHGITRKEAHPGLGFRCARSARPRFLEP